MSNSQLSQADKAACWDIEKMVHEESANYAGLDYNLCSDLGRMNEIENTIKTQGIEKTLELAKLAMKLARKITKEMNKGESTNENG